MATKKGGLFGFFENIIVDARRTVQNTLGRPQNTGAEPPSSPTPPAPTEVPQQTQTPAPPSIKPAWKIPEIDESVVYKAGEGREFKEAEVKGKYGSQLEQWTAEIKPTEDQRRQQEEDVVLFPVGRRMQAPATPDRSTSSRPESSAPQPRAGFGGLTEGQYLLLLAARPKSWKDRLFDGFAGAIPGLPRPKSSEERVEEAIQQLIAQEKLSADNPEVQALRASREALTREVEEEVLRGDVVRSVRFIPPQRYEQEKFNVGGNVLQPMTVDPSGLIRFLPRDFTPPVGSQIGSAAGKVVGSATKDLATQGLVAGRGLALNLGRTLGGWGVGGIARIGTFLAGLGGGAAGAPIAAGVLIAIIGGVIVFAFLFMMTGPTFTRQAAFVGTGGPSVLNTGSQYVSVQVNVSKSSFKNEELPNKATYSVTVKEKGEPLSNLSIQGTLTASNKNGTRTISSSSWTDSTKSIDVDLGNDLTDTNVTLSVLASAKVASQPNIQTETGNSIITIGNPPSDCPSGWPTTQGFITRGPGVATHVNAEAIDIGYTPNGQSPLVGKPIYATSKGSVTVQDHGTQDYGRHVILRTICNGKTVNVIYAHMDAVNVSTGQNIEKGTVLGTVGSTGNSTGPHLHYEFQALPMGTPYIPSNIPAGCEGGCGIKWP